MRVLRNIFLWILLVAVLVGLIVGGMIGWAYHKTDPAGFTAPAVTAGGTGLSVNSYHWHAPVMGGILFKESSSPETLSAPLLGNAEWSEMTMDVQLPAGYPTHFVVTDAAGAAVLDVNNAADVTIAFPANGSYRLEALVTVPEHSADDHPGAPAHGYGSFRYTARVQVNAPPKVEFSSLSVRQGDVITVRLKGFFGGAAPEIETPLSAATFCDLPDGGKAASIGVHYNREPGEYPVHVVCGEVDVTETVKIIHRDFPKEFITVDSAVSDATVNSEAANAEWRSAIFPLYEAADPQRYWEGRFIRPCEAEDQNSPYGLYRYVNGSRYPTRHAGTDYDCDLGDEVWAPNKGKVLFADFLALTGNTVVVEHGGGLKSYFFHLDSIACARGDLVEKKQILGTAGTTGYSTGPHLHYEARIGNQSIDPDQLFNGTSGLYFAE